MGPLGLQLLALVATLVLAAVDRSILRGGISSGYLVIALITFGYVSAGALIASRVRGNPIGWILMGMGAALVIGALSEQYVLRALIAAPGSLPVPGFMAWLGNSVLLLIILPVPIVFLLFPTGRAASRRLRWVLQASICAAVIGVVGTIVYPGEEDGITNSLKEHGLRLVNPTGIRATKGLVGALLAVAGLVGLAAALLAIVSLVLRYRRADGQEREQFKWLAFVAVGTLILLVVLVTSGLYLSDTSPVGTVLWVATLAFGLVGIPAAISVAILKYRLYDVDVVINKALVYGSLAAFITAVYVGIVVGIGTALGHGSTKPNVPLSILATIVVAVVFQPVRARVQTLANRLVYGKRATPYEVLSTFSRRMGETYASEELLVRMARILAEGTGGASAGVWLADGATLRCAASWPPESPTPTERVPATPDGLPEPSDRSLFLPVLHRGELLGALEVTKAPGDRLTPAERKLAGDLASQAGLVLHNAQLLADLLASRRRLVAARDQERRKLERNLHDGAQQQLVALQIKVGLARTVLRRDPGQAEPLLAQLRTEATDALETLRDLARGIYPPLLRDHGLVAALEAQARKAALPVTVEAVHIDRYPEEAEAAVYFCVLEGLQNVAKYAGATRATVRLGASNGDLRFEVEDDGAGFDTARTSYGTGLQGIADRLAALGGELSVASHLGAGTTISGRVPVAHRVMESVS